MVDRQLGEAYARALAGIQAPNARLRYGVLLDLLGDDRSLRPALRHLIEQPGFEALRSSTSPAVRLAGRDSWLKELAAWCNEESLRRVSGFLDGLLDLQPSQSVGSGGRDGDVPRPSAGAGEPAPEDRATAAAQREERVRRLRDQGLEASNQGDHHRAIALLSEALKLDSSNVLLYVHRASVQAILGYTEGAIEDFSCVLRLEPGHRDALAQRGRAKAAIGLMEEALDDWRRASDLGHKQAREWLRRHEQAASAQRKAPRQNAGHDPSTNRGQDSASDGQARTEAAGAPEPPSSSAGAADSAASPEVEAPLPTHLRVEALQLMSPRMQARLQRIQSLVDQGYAVEMAMGIFPYLRSPLGARVSPGFHGQGRVGGFSWMGCLFPFVFCFQMREWSYFWVLGVFSLAANVIMRLAGIDFGVLFNLVLGVMYGLYLPYLRFLWASREGASLTRLPVSIVGGFLVCLVAGIPALFVYLF